MALVTAVVLVPSPASAQDSAAACFPGSGADYPPAGPAVAIEASLSLQAGDIDPPLQLASADVSVITIAGAQPGATYCGTLFSTPVTILPTVASPSGVLTFRPAVGRDFELGAPHHLDVFRNRQLVGAFDFCVTKTGAVTPLGKGGCRAAAGTKLARTGGDRLLEMVQIAALALAVGAAFIYLRRRRQAAATPKHT